MEEEEEEEEALLGSTSLHPLSLNEPELLIMLENIISSIQISFLARRSSISTLFYSTILSPPPLSLCSFVLLGFLSTDRDTSRDVYNVFEGRIVLSYADYTPPFGRDDFMKETSDGPSVTVEIFSLLAEKKLSLYNSPRRVVR